MSTIEKSQELKGLESQLQSLSGKVKAKKEEFIQAQKEYTQMANSEKQLKEKVEALRKPTELRVTEHAVLRYLERVNKIDLKEIEKAILTPELVKMTEVLGKNGKYPVSDFSVVIRDGAIVTVEKE